MLSTKWILSAVTFRGNARWLAVAVIILLSMYFLAKQSARISSIQRLKSGYNEYNFIVTAIKQSACYLFFGMVTVVLIVALYEKNKKFDNIFWLICILCSYFFFKKAAVLKHVFNQEFFPPFDIFISYKSDNSEFVRQVADALLSLGCNVWFDEYIITSIEEYHEAESIIMNDIYKSKRGIIFTDRKYLEAKWCIMEAENLLTNCGKSNIIQIRLDNTRIPILPERGAILNNCNKDNVNEVVRFISKYINLPINNSPEIIQQRYEQDYCQSVYIYFGTEYDKFHINIHGWQVKALSGNITKVRMKDGEIRKSNPGPVIHKTVLDVHGREIMIGMNLYYDIDTEFKKKTKDLIIKDKDSRELRKELLKYSENHIDNIKKCIGEVSEIRGAHLLHYKERGHLALTYYMDDANYWTRKISIHLTREGRDAYEFVFTFGFFGPFREYCRHAHLMDKVATSIEWL